mmetsp:Transcript_36214/g.82664  ORF Transcript_36214/g.82664 Transcript_36214/m.82664 type:complete len:207 (-) Transcript_36214:822-1442(-)
MDGYHLGSQRLDLLGCFETESTPPRHGHHAYQRSQASSDRDERRRYPHPRAQQPTQVAPRAVPEAPVYALHQALHGRPDAGGSELGETHRRREPDQVEDRGPYELSREERGLRRDPQPVAAGGETDVEEESQGQAAYSRGHDGIRTERALQFPREPRRQNAADRERGPVQPQVPRRVYCLARRQRVVNLPDLYVCEVLHHRQRASH